MIIDRSREQGHIITGTPKTYVAFVLDQSGSMKNVLYPTIDGFNKQLDTIKNEANINTYVSLVTFNSAVMPIFFNRSISNVPTLGTHNYKPEGWTALYDAVGYTINRLENEAEYDGNTAFLVVIVSDGQENRSVDYNRNRISSLVRQKKSTGRWTFVYIGSNQDLSDAMSVFDLPHQNVFDWQYTPIGTAAAYGANSVGLSNYLTARNAGLTFTSNFFDTESSKLNISTSTPLNLSTTVLETKTEVKKDDTNDKG